MKNYFALLGTICSLAFSGAIASAAVVVPIGTLPPSTPYFFITGATAGDAIVTANFGNTIAGVTAFDDTFQFTLPLSGTGSGSVSTSFSSVSTQIAITSVLIDGVSYSPAVAALGISNVPIAAGILNSIEVIGQTGSDNVLGTFAGTATFSAASFQPAIGSVPEPATWAMMLLGMGMIGFAARRRVTVSVASA